MLDAYKGPHTLFREEGRCAQGKACGGSRPGFAPAQGIDALFACPSTMFACPHCARSGLSRCGVPVRIGGGRVDEKRCLRSRLEKICLQQSLDSSSESVPKHLSPLLSDRQTKG